MSLFDIGKLHRKLGTESKTGINTGVADLLVVAKLLYALHRDYCEQSWETILGSCFSGIQGGTGTSL